MRTIPQLAAILLTGAIFPLATGVCSGDILLMSSTARVEGSGTVGRAASFDSQSFDESSNDLFGLVSLNETQTVGPLDFENNQLPGTAAVGISTASTSIDYSSLDEIIIDMFSQVSLNSIETDGLGDGSYGVNSQSSFVFDFTVDEATNYQFDGAIEFMDDTPSWQIRLLGVNGFLFNNLTNNSGDELIASGVLQPGSNYSLSGFASNGLGGVTPFVENSTSIGISFQALRAVPEPASGIVILAAVFTIALRRRR